MPAGGLFVTGGWVLCACFTSSACDQNKKERPMLSRAAWQGSCRAAPCAWAQVGAVATRSSSSSSSSSNSNSNSNNSCSSSSCASSTTPLMSSALKDQHDFFMSTMMCPTSLPTRHASSSKMPAVRLEQMRRASSSSSRHAVRLHRSRADRCILPGGCVRPRGFRSIAGLPSTPPLFRRAERRDCQQQSGAPASFVRAFGGQSVVPWELALFLVEEMKGEGVEPGDVVYTAALAECRWAGQSKHVEYLLQQMEAEGMSIVPGIPGATDDHLPPSQAPTIFKNSPGKTPSNSRDGGPPQDQSMAPNETQNNASSAIAAATAAARTADKALATVEAMWAAEEHEPSPATCRAALDACAVGGQWDRALSLVRDSAMAMGSDGGDGAGATGNPGVVGEGSVSTRVEGLALEGRWDDAFLLAQQGGAE